jgi:hypothetical protein
VIFGEGEDPLRGPLHIVKVEPELAVLHQPGQRGAVFGANYDLDAQPGRRFHEVVRTVGAARDKEKDARHHR